MFCRLTLTQLRSVHTNVVRSLQSSVVGDVFSERLFSIDVFSVDNVAAVLINHTFSSLTKRLH